MKVLLLPLALLLSMSAWAQSEAQSTNRQPAASSYAPAGNLDQAMADGTFKQITSVLVSVEGTTVYESYWGEGSAARRNDTRSATKTLVAMAVGAAIADGYLESADSPVLPFFADELPVRFSSQAKDQITVRDLLTMSSALDCNDNVWESPGNEEHMYPARRWTYFVLDLPARPDYARDEAGLGPFAYCTAGSFLLGQVVERASGQPVDRYLADRLFTPLGIEEARWDRSPSNEVMTGGGTELTSRDLLKLGELLLNGGAYGGKQLLPAAWVDQMMFPHRTANERQQYGYQIWSADFTCGDGTVTGWYMAGNGGNKIAVFADLNAVVVVTATLYGTRGMHQQTTDILNRYVLPGLAPCR